jgi:hypothetical protein
MDSNLVQILSKGLLIYENKTSRNIYEINNFYKLNYIAKWLILNNERTKKEKREPK